MSTSAVVRVPPRVGAFFDMDKTLIAENSGSLFMKYRYQKGEIGGIDLLKGLGAYIQYKLGVLDIRSWTKNMMLQFRGQSEAELEKEALQWFDDMVAETVYPEAAQIVRGHLDAGHVVAIVSGSMRFVVEPGGVEVQVGASSEDIRQSARFEIQGELRNLSTAEIVPTRVEVT